jgi:hypothetical protein
MTIAAKLSRKLYETFGHKAAEDMVDWMRQVENQRAELRELNDLSSARIDSRFGEFSAEVRAGFARVDEAMGTGFARIDARFAEFRAETHVGLAQLETKLERRFSDLMKWSFVFWVGSTVTLVVALAALRR